MNITMPFRQAASTSSTSGWSKPESRIPQPTRHIVHTIAM